MSPSPTKPRKTPPSDVSATQWSLTEVFVIVTIACISSLSLAAGHWFLGAFLFATAVSVRTAVVDYSAAGELANAGVVVFGIPTLILALLCAMS